MPEEVIRIAGISITEEIALWKKDNPEIPITPSIMLYLALEWKGRLTEDELRCLKKEFKKNKQKYKDMPFGNQSSFEEYVDRVLYLIEYRIMLVSSGMEHNAPMLFNSLPPHQQT